MTWNAKWHEMSWNLKCHEMSNVMKCQESWNADANAGSMTPSRNTRRYTLWSVPSSPVRSFFYWTMCQFYWEICNALWCFDEGKYNILQLLKGIYKCKDFVDSGGHEPKDILAYIHYHRANINQLFLELLLSLSLSLSLYLS